MNRFERWFVQRIIAREVRQGLWHFKNTVGLYEMIREAWSAEFTEDNAATSSECLSECFEASQVGGVIDAPPNNQDKHP